jgi:hypothetical protein
MAAAVDEVTVKGTSSILGWYDNGRPMWIDLVGDYAGRELFLVEGDSLLRECFEDERIDFHGNLPRVCPTFLFGLEWRPLPYLTVYYFNLDGFVSRLWYWTRFLVVGACSEDLHPA